MYIFIIFLLFILFNLTKNKYDFDWLSKKENISIRGIMAIIVLLGHSWIRDYDNIYLQFLCNYIIYAGYLAVSYFFFSSGYGITIKIINNKLNIKEFFKQRILNIILIYELTNIIYLLWFNSFERFNLKKIIFSFFYPIYNGPAWYLFALIIMYIFYFIAINISKNKQNIYIFLSLFCLLYSIIIIITDLGNWWFCSSFSFPFGVWFAFNKNKLNLKSRKYIRNLTFFIGSIFLVLYSILILVDLNTIGIVFIKSTSSLIFVFFICLLNKRICIKKNSLWYYLGIYSEGIYLFMWLSRSFVKEYLLVKSNDISEILIIIISIFLGILFCKLKNIFISRRNLRFEK